MKILFKVMNFSGGAPLSMLEYVKLLRDRRYDIAIAGKYLYSQERFFQHGLLVYNVPCFDIHCPLGNFFVYQRVAKLLNSEKPDFLVWWTGYECIFGRLISLYYNLPCLYVYAGGEMLGYMKQALRGEKILVFSEENRVDLMKQGYVTSNVDVVSNRLKVDIDSNTDQFYQELKFGGVLRLLLPSRLDAPKLNSIRTAINWATQLEQSQGNIQLDIVGAGSCAEQVEHMVKDANMIAGRKFVNLLGYVDNLPLLFMKSHIVFGKGRSVIEPIMMGRIAIILGEDGRASLCNAESVNNLAMFNFSGRGIAYPIDFDGFRNIVVQIRNGDYDYSSVDDAAEQIRSLYDIKLAGDRIEAIILDRITRFHANSINHFIRFLYCFKEYIRIYILAILDKMRFSLK